MSRIDYNFNTVWNSDKCQNFAGKHFEEMEPRLEAIQNPGKEKVEPERKDKQLYYISSNGYYGYLPIMPVSTHDECPMDTDDSNVEIPVFEVNEKTETFGVMKTESGFSVGITLGRRKRDRGEDNSVEWSKKQRKEEQESVIVDTEGNYLDLLENLLKETHGCDLYNYVTCDF